MAVQKKYQALGRGLDALIATGEVKTSGSSSIGEISVSLIVPNPNQPRRDFSDKSLDELADSIKELGIVQPITLRNMGDGSYQIIAGERRWRAAQRAGLKTVPAYIRTADDEKTMQMALKNKEIDQGHARALLGLPSAATQLKVFEEIKSQGLSVRKVEEMVNRLNSGEDVNNSGKRIRARRDKDNSDEYNALQKHLSDHFGTKVKMTCSPEGKGKITIPFRNQEEMERIIAMLDKGK